MSIYKVYKITNRLNGKIYVGQTKQPIEKRFMQHLSTNSPLGQAMRQCGAENFTIEVIEECETQAQVNEREIFWIKVLNCKVPNGYNLLVVGSGGNKRTQQKDMEKNSIGKKIRERRFQLELTQRQIADYVGVTEATVSRWESGEIDNMRRDKIANLAKVLKVSPLLIMGIDEETNIKSNDTFATFEERELVNSFNSLTADGKNVIWAMLNSLRVTHSATV